MPRGPGVLALVSHEEGGCKVARLGCHIGNHNHRRWLQNPIRALTTAIDVKHLFTHITMLFFIVINIKQRWSIKVIFSSLSSKISVISFTSIVPLIKFVNAVTSGDKSDQCSLRSVASCSKCLSSSNMRFSIATTFTLLDLVIIGNPSSQGKNDFVPIIRIRIIPNKEVLNWERQAQFKVDLGIETTSLNCSQRVDSLDEQWILLCYWNARLHSYYIYKGLHPKISHGLLLSI